jgi:predicted nucleic acid-binding protein
LNVHVDTSLLVHAFATPEHRTIVDAAIERGDRLVASSVVEYEWRRGPRSPEQLLLFDAFFLPDSLVPFSSDDARRAANLYGMLSRAKARQVDIMIAACAIEHGAALWTLNEADFADIPALQLYR